MAATDLNTPRVGQAKAKSAEGKMMAKTETSSKRAVEIKRKRDSQKKNCSTKRHRPDKCSDAAVAQTKKDMSDPPPSNKHTGVEDQHQSHNLATYPIPGCNSDDFRSSCIEVSQVRDDQEWSLEKLRNAPADIGRVQSLISHLMLVGMSTATDTLNADSDDEVAHAERTLDILHDQCHVMLKGLQCHLELLFQHFEYKPLK